MKAFRIHGVGDLRLVDVPEPRLQPGEVLLRPLYTGVCSTDLHILYSGALVRELPVTLGHEFSATVVEVSPVISWAEPYPQSRPLRIGDRVCVEPMLPCMRCYYCLRGRVNLCPHMRHLGITQDGSLAELVRAPAARCTPLPEELTDQEGALTEVLACGVNFVEAASIAPGDTVAVVGGGPMGQMAAQVALACGAERVVMSEPSPQRRDVATRLGVHITIAAEAVDPVVAVRDLTGGRGADVTLECVGLEQAVQQALDMTRRGGCCVLGGVPVKPLCLTVDEIVLGEKRVVGAVASAWHFGTALALIVDRRVNPDGAISRDYAFADTPDALRAAHERRDMCKLMIRH